MTKLDTVEKYLKWSQKKVDQLKLYKSYEDYNVTYDSSSKMIVKKDLINYIEQALNVVRRL